MTKDITTEKKILDAAHDVFIEKGMDGARTKEIAERAGINKALLHYYYRTKDTLFLAVFKKVASRIVPKLTDLVTSDISFFELLEDFIERYIDILIKNPFLPGFILHEINRSPANLANVFIEAGIKPELITNLIEKAYRDGLIRKVDPKHLLVNIFSLCVFPVAAKPLLQRVFFENDSMAYKAFLKERAKEVSSFIIHSIKVEQ